MNRTCSLLLVSVILTQFSSVTVQGTVPEAETKAEVSPFEAQSVSSETSLESTEGDFNLQVNTSKPIPLQVV